MKAIIPCAGYGSRMSMEIDKSKEMLLDVLGNPIIDYSLSICTNHKLTPLVITRAEKTDLITYCKEKNVETLIIEPKREWPYTVFQSHIKWDQYNLLLLPDTRFSPHSVVNNIKEDLYMGADISLGLHEVINPDKWCIVQNYTLFEKPKEFHGKQYAFGVIGFKRSAGLQLFHDLNIEKRAVLRNTSFQYLNTFRDITRTGIVEE